MRSLILILFLTVSLQAQEFGEWRISEDSMLKCADCTFGHGSASWIIADLLDDHMAWWKADLITLGAGIAWEVKDGYVPWEKYGVLGGEGFSRNDIYADLTGIIIHRIKESIVGEKIKVVIQKVPVIRRVVPKKEK